MKGMDDLCTKSTLDWIAFALISEPQSYQNFGIQLSPWGLGVGKNWMPRPNRAEPREAGERISLSQRHPLNRFQRQRRTVRAISWDIRIWPFVEGHSDVVISIAKPLK
jgi:hypothetical protein